MVYHINFKGEKIVEISRDQTILEASLEAGIPHYHECGGHAKCSTCRVLILEGKEDLTRPNTKELKLKSILGFNDDIRLACQTKVTGNHVALRRIIRDKTDVNLYSHLYPRDDSSQEIGEEKELALFFLDVRDFTPFMEKHLAFDVIHIIRRLFRIFRNGIETNNGKIIETAGDGLYAVFGFDYDLPTAVKLAVKAGQQILADLDLFNKTYAENYFGNSFQVGIGLHAGNVIVGNIGLGISNDLTVMGLPVNVASRLQAATKAINNSFLVSEYAHSFITGQPGFEKAVPVSLKGVSDEVKVFLLGNRYK